MVSPAIPSPPCLFGGVASLPPAPFCASHHTCRLRHCKSNSLNNPNNRTILPSQPLAAFAAIRRRWGRRRRHWRWLRVFLSLTVCRVRGESRAFLLRAIFAVGQCLCLWRRESRERVRVSSSAFGGTTLARNNDREKSLAPRPMGAFARQVPLASLALVAPIGRGAALASSRPAQRPPRPLPAQRRPAAMFVHPSGSRAV